MTLHLVGVLVASGLTFLASSAKAGDPFHNLSWYLKDVVVAATISQEDYISWRQADPWDSEMAQLENSAPDAVWIERAHEDEDVSKTTCSDFRTRTFAEWQERTSVDADLLPQWREAWHGVETRVSHSVWSAKLRRIDLAAAIKATGVPDSAFVEQVPGALLQEFFDTAATFTDAGFDRMQHFIESMSMVLVRSEVCEGFVLYVWAFK